MLRLNIFMNELAISNYLAILLEEEIEDLKLDKCDSSIF